MRRMTMNKVGRLFLAVAAAFLAAPVISGHSQTPGGAVEMKVKWIEGKRYEMRLTANERVVAFESGKPENVVNSIIGSWDFSIVVKKSRAQMGAELDMELGDLNITVSKLGKTTQFNSRSNPNQDHAGQIKAWMRKMKQQHIRFKLGPEGNVQEISNLEEFSRQIADGAPQSAEDLLQLFDENSLRRIWLTSEAMPSKPVVLGEMWSCHYETARRAGDFLDADLRAAFKGREGRGRRHLAIVDFAGDMAPGSDDLKKGQAEVSLTGKIAGNFRFDVEAGAIAERESNYDFEVLVRGGSVGSRISQSFKVKLIRTVDLNK